MRNILLAGLAWLALGAANAASAEDFTITVPVRIENLRHASSVTAYCLVMRQIPSAVSQTGSASVPLVGGSFNGDVTVRVSIEVGQSRTDFNEYNCWLQFYFPDPTGPRPNFQVGTDDAALAYYTRKTGQELTTTSVQMRAIGRLP